MGHQTEDDTETPECFQRIPQLLNGTAMHHDPPSLDEAIEEPNHVMKHQTPSAYEMDEVQIEIQRLQSDIDSLNAYNRNLERDNAEMASIVSENQELRKQLDALTRKLEAKNTKGHSLGASGNNATELAHMKVQPHTLKDTNALVTEIRILQENINELKAHTKVDSDNQTTISVLQAKLASEQKMNEQLTTKLLESSSTLEQITDLSKRLRSRHENTWKELEGLRAKLDAAEKDRDWHRKQHSEILEVRNTIKAARASDDKGLVQKNNELKKENSRLKQDLADLDKQVEQHFRGIADFITHLDLAAEEVRVYTCTHKDLKDITPKSDKSTRIKPMGLVANEMYRNWADDEDFQHVYKEARRSICNHHEAHEKAGHRNGDGVNQVQSALNEVDGKRNFARLLSLMKS